MWYRQDKNSLLFPFYDVMFCAITDLYHKYLHQMFCKLSLFFFFALQCCYIFILGSVRW